MNRYQKLARDVKRIQEESRKSCSGVSDGGSCNLDHPALYLPRWRDSKIRAAFEDIGEKPPRSTKRHGRRVFTLGGGPGQAGRNTFYCEKVRDGLKDLGYDATVIYITD